MQLADAIESWGRAHRSEMSQDELEALGTVWRTIKTSPYADLDFRGMSKEDGRAVMALFAQPQRAEVSATLNRVRRWALAQPQTEPPAAPVTPVTPTRTGLPGTETVVMRSPQPEARPGGPGPAIGPTGTVTPVGPTSGSVTAVSPTGAAPMTPSADPLGHGPVQGWEPPTGAAPTGGDDGPPWRVIGIVVGAIAALALIWFLFLRGDDDAQTVASGDVDAAATTVAGSTGGVAAAPAATVIGDTTDTAGQPTFDGAGSDDFCTVARQLDESDPFANIDFFGPEFFADAISLFDRIEGIAPAEIRNDIAITANQLRAMDALAAQYDYNLFDPALGEAMSNLDTSAADAAGERIDAYLASVCGIVTDPVDDGLGTTGTDAIDTGDLPALTDEQARLLNEAFLAQFDISEELAQCLATELGDLTAAATDATLLNQPVCGTTLFNVIAGQAG